jgi:hypothetical protein
MMFGGYSWFLSDDFYDLFGPSLSDDFYDLFGPSLSVSSSGSVYSLAAMALCRTAEVII